MQTTIIAIGKTTYPYLIEGISDYLKRLAHYSRVELIEIPPQKNKKSLDQHALIEQEGNSLLKHCQAGDRVYLFDENGKSYSSRELATFYQKQMNMGAKRLILLIGGAYGFSDAVKSRANGSISLSKLTFSHQMVRLIIVEQIYRAHTILKGEPYHHD
jgi:23S rRNA (pseudouridine1915-N3)-methyltransferase